MHASTELARESFVNHAVALDSGLSLERIRHNMHPEMALAPGAMTGMPLMQVGFVDHLEAVRGEGLGQLVDD